MNKLYVIIMVLTLGNMSISAAPLMVKQNNDVCVTELTRFDVSGTSQKKTYLVELNKRQRKLHQNHKANNGGDLVYIQQDKFHVEAVVTKDRLFQLYLTDETHSKEEQKEVRIKVGTTVDKQEYKYFIPNYISSKGAYELKLPSSISGSEIEVEILFPNRSHSEILYFDLEN